MAEEQKMPETQAGTQPNGQQPAQEAPQPAADAPHSCPEEGPGQETTKEHKEHKPGKEALHAQLAAAQQKAEDLSAQLAQAKDTLMRTAAEYDNFRKRSQKERDAAFGNGVSFAVEKLLGVIDTLELAANAQTADEAYKKGVLMTLDKAKAALKALNVEEIEAEGLPFDPQCHAAVMQQPAPEGVESGTILAVMQRGYRRDGKVIRHAAVTVAE